MRLVILQSAVLLFLTFVRVSTSFSDVGKWDLSLSGKSCEFQLAKSLFKGSKIEIEIHCDVMNSTTIRVNYKWTPEICSPDYFHYFEKRIVNCTNEIESYIAQDSIITQNYNCLGKSLIVVTTDRVMNADSTTQNKTSETPNSLPFAVERDGVYQLWMTVESDKKYNASMKVSMYLPSSGYLSAAMWPLLPFFGVMCGFYTVLCTCWLIICGLQWRDLLRIQFWIGGVALLGMIETATYYGVYSSVNKTGYFNAEAYMFAEWISVAKRALARMLVIIVSLGFGIVKPRLGPALQRVVGAGLAWGALAAIEAWLRLHHKANDSNRDLLLSEAPLSLLDSAICWWVFVSLSYTMRTLQLRRNTIKLSLYKHFTNTLIFAVVSSVIFMLYSIRTYRVHDCISSWREVWIDEAYWHILFASVLTVIMILWRPTNNNQRYAFTPLLDNAEDDDDEEEQFVNDAYGVKMRGTSISGGGGGAGGGAGGDGYSDAAGAGAGAAGRERERDQHEANSLDSDLRWVEENIPTSTLPLLDSDEEIINTKFEVSKMQ